MYKSQTSKRNLRSSLLLAAASVAVVAVSAPAMAQDTAVETVVVTGSRIPTTNLTSASPITVATAEQINQTADFSIEDVIGKVIGPDAAVVTNGINNGGAGIAEVGFRDLGATRTLVLMDGQRLIPTEGTVDLNTIPVALVDHIEILKDGASSVYGADAIGGVLNIITKKNYSGFEVDGEGGASQHGGGDTYAINAMMGLNTDKGNVTIAVTHDQQEPVYQYQRAWANALLPRPNGSDAGNVYRSQLDILQNENDPSEVFLNGVQRDTSDPTLAAEVPCLAYVGTGPGTGVTKLNAGCHSPEGAWNAETSSLKRDQITADAHYDLTNNITFVLNSFFSEKKTGQSIRPEPLLGDTIANGTFNGFIIPASWPGNTTGGDFVAYLTPLQFGPRLSIQTTDTYRIQAGLQGHFWADWNWEAGWVRQRLTAVFETKNFGNFLHLAQETGQVACTADVPGGCEYDPTFGYDVPVDKINFFDNSPENIFTPDQLNFVRGDFHENISQLEDYGYADINGGLFELPWGKDQEVKFSLGAERRFESYTDIPDTLVSEGWAANEAGPSGAHYSVSSAYAELSVPLLKDLPFVESLDFTPSARYDDYSTFGSAKTWKLGLNWQSTDWIRFRGTMSTGFRAPNVSELGAAGGLSDNNASGDPCDTRGSGFHGLANVGQGILTAGSQCALALAHVAGAENGAGDVVNFNPAVDNNIGNTQLQVEIGGNPSLKPETSHEWTAGTVITPTFAPGLSFAGDYYFVTINNAVLDGGLAGAIGLDALLTGCYGPSQNAAYCANIHRDANGNILTIDSRNGNFGVQKVRGMDLEVDYNTADANWTLPIPGAINLSATANRVTHYTVENPDGTTSHYLGHFTESESIYPTWKGTFNFDYNLDAFDFHYDTQYIDHMTDFDSGAPAHTAYDYIPAYWYHNISVSYELGALLGVTQSSRLTFGINNLLDKDPPLLNIDGNCKCNTLAGPYDVTGRFFFTKISTEF